MKGNLNKTFFAMYHLQSQITIINLWFMINYCNGKYSENLRTNDDATHYGIWNQQSLCMLN
jgi:hypothetical protein